MAKVMEFLDIPGDAMFELPVLRLTGGNRLLIENHRGLHDYMPDKVLLAIKGGYVEIAGESLEVGSMTRDSMLITGKITNIAYKRSGGRV